MNIYLKTLLLLSLIVPPLSRGQDSTRRVPDGTEGEFLEMPDTSAAVGKGGKWNEFDTKLTTVKFGLGFLYEVAAYSQDEESKQQFDLETGYKVRDFRVLISGIIKSERAISWKTGIMYDGPTDRWLVRETGVTIGVPELWGRIFVGRTKEGFSLNKVMNGYAGWMMERQMAVDIIPILGDGVRWMAFLPAQGLFWDAGVFTDWLSHEQSFSTYDWQVAARVGWLPVSTDDAVLHVGLNGRYGDVEDGQLQVRSRPEASPAPFFLDAGRISTDHTNHFGVEAYYRNGPLMTGTEIYIHNIHSPVSDNPVFRGGELFVSYIVSGETRPYVTPGNIFAFIDTKNSVFDGGPGTWEAIVRLSTLDLNDGLITGGSFWRLTPQVNWYLSNNFRLEFSYGYGVLDRFDVKGGTHFFQSRIQVLM